MRIFLIQLCYCGFWKKDFNSWLRFSVYLFIISCLHSSLSCCFVVTERNKMNRECSVGVQVVFRSCKNNEIVLVGLGTRWRVFCNRTLRVNTLRWGIYKTCETKEVQQIFKETQKKIRKCWYYERAFRTFTEPSVRCRYKSWRPSRTLSAFCLLQMMFRRVECNDKCAHMWIANVFNICYVFRQSGSVKTCKVLYSWRQQWKRKHVVEVN